MKRYFGLLLVLLVFLSGCGGLSEQSGDGSMATEASREESNTESTVKQLDLSRLVVFGDSITALSDWGKETAARANMYFFNGAMGGLTSEQALGRFDAYVATREADFVTLCFGMNDMLMTAKHTPKVTLERFGENLTELIRRIRELNAVPILLTTNPLNNDVFFASQGQSASLYEGKTPLEWLDLYNQVTREVAQKEQVLLVDMRQACDAFSVTEVLAADGIHLSAKGSEVFSDTLYQALTENFTVNPDAGEITPELPVIVEAGASASLISFEPEGWYTPDTEAMKFVKASDGGLAAYNTNGLWPEAHYAPTVPLAVNKETGSIYVSLKTGSVNASIILFFGGATPSAYTDGQYIVINPFLGCELAAGSGDISQNQTIQATIRLSSLQLPESAFDGNGNVIISGVKLFVAGTAYQRVTIYELSANG